MPSQQNHFGYLLDLAACSLMLVLCSCGGGRSAGLAIDPATAAGFQLRVLDETFQGAPPTGDFSLKLEPQAAGWAARIQVTGAAGLKACYFELAYDAAAYDPVRVKPGSALEPPDGGAAGCDEHRLVLSILDEPGLVTHGQILVHPDEQAGFSGDGWLATIEFADRPFAPRAASQPPTGDASLTTASWDPVSHILSWRYTCQGDYNQDGFVTISDLTPLGQSYLAEGPFHPDTALYQVDGNGDGLISINDITPIGQNFGLFVEGYEVYASSDPGDLPPDNSAPPALAALDYLPFSQHGGDPLTDRLTFAVEYPELGADNIVWVRPVSEAQAGTPSTPLASLAYEWTIGFPLDFAGVTAGSTHPALAQIAGLPAILYLDGQQQLVFQRALDVKGMAWDTAVVVAQSANAGSACSLLEVDGLAAVCQHEAASGRVEYTRASDAAGNAWSEPVVIATTAGGGGDCHLWLVAGHPAVCFTDFTAGQLYFARAADPLGNAWGAPQAIADLGAGAPGAGRFSSPAQVDGYPALAYYHSEARELRFIRAADPLGTAWGDAVVAASGADVGRYCSLAEVQGAPAIAYLSDVGLAYTRAADAAGATWTDHLELDRRWGADVALAPSLAMIGGKPAISYYSGEPAADLLYLPAVDPLGEIWGTPQAIGADNQAGQSSCLLEQAGKPTIACLAEATGQVLYAHSGTPEPGPPVALLSAYPAPVAVDEDVTFDATRSYAQAGAIESFAWDLDGDGSYELAAGPQPTQVRSYSAPGNYLAAVRVVDQAGRATEAHYYLTVGTPGTPPRAGLTADPLDAALGQNVHFSAADSVDEDGTLQLFEWDVAGDGDFEIATGAVPELDYEYSAAGVYNAAVRVTDDQGLKDIVAVCINVGILNQRPSAVLTASPLSGNPPLVVDLDGSASSDPDGTIVSYEWDLNDDGLFEYNGGTSATLQWLCEQPGSHRPRLRVTDNLQAQATAWVQISGNLSPIAMLTADNFNGTAPYMVSLDCSGSHDPDGLITTWAIDLHNDGVYEEILTTPPGVWQFENIWNGPTQVRLKVKDNQGATSSAMITVNATHGWHVYTLDPVGLTGLDNALDIVNGQPAIAYYEWYSRSLKYIRATDTYGYSAWATPVNLGAIAPTGFSSYAGPVSLACLNGVLPAIAFEGYLTTGSFYAVAQNGQGSSWHPFIAQWPDIHTYQVFDLEVVNSKPALAYYNTYTGLEFATAKDGQGLQWNKPTILSPGAGGANLAVINGHPAIVYSQAVSSGGGQTASALCYLRATNPSGSQWGPQVVIDSSAECQAAQLATISGYPAVAYVVSIQGHSEVWFKRADNLNGTAWTSPPKVIHPDGREVLGLVEINGKPAIGLVTCQGRKVMYFLSNDATGSSWPSGMVVDDLPVFVTSVVTMFPQGEMIGINGHPAMSYCDSCNGDLKYAVLE